MYDFHVPAAALGRAPAAEALMAAAPYGRPAAVPGGLLSLDESRSICSCRIRCEKLGGVMSMTHWIGRPVRFGCAGGSCHSHTLPGCPDGLKM